MFSKIQSLVSSLSEEFQPKWEENLQNWYANQEAQEAPALNTLNELQKEINNQLDIYYACTIAAIVAPIFAILHATFLSLFLGVLIPAYSLTKRAQIYQAFNKFLNFIENNKNKPISPLLDYKMDLPPPGYFRFCFVTIRPTFPSHQLTLQPSSPASSPGNFYPTPPPHSFRQLASTSFPPQFPSYG